MRKETMKLLAREKVAIYEEEREEAQRRKAANDIIVKGEWSGGIRWP